MQLQTLKLNKESNNEDVSFLSLLGRNVDLKSLSLSDLKLKKQQYQQIQNQVQNQLEEIDKVTFLLDLRQIQFKI